MPPKSKAGEDDDDEGNKGPKGNYIMFKAEGDLYQSRTLWDKAISCYTRALELKEADAAALVNRAKCLVRLGDTEKALQDVDVNLKKEEIDPKSLLQKAETLYSEGKFEMALVYFHRGQKLVPESQPFRLGIQKSVEAIEKAVGDSAIELTKKGDLSFFQKEIEADRLRKLAELNKLLGEPEMQISYRKKVTVLDEVKTPVKDISLDKRIKELLAELYGDRVYLEIIMNEADKKTEIGRDIADEAYEAIMFLDKKVEFWRQENPAPRKRKAERLPTIAAERARANQWVTDVMNQIDEAQSKGLLQESLDEALRCFATVEAFPPGVIHKREEVLATLHDYIGNAYLELGNPQKALDHFKMEKSAADRFGIAEAKSRALDNMGRSYARMGEFKKAINIWNVKLPLAKTECNEKAWLFHEMGRCHYELGNYKRAKELGEKSINEALAADDTMWQLNSNVLVAQANVRLDDLKAALDSFYLAHDLAEIRDDKMSLEAIKRAIEELNRRIVSRVVKEAETEVVPLDTDEKGTQLGPEEEEEEEEEMEEEEEEEKKLRDVLSKAVQTDDVFRSVAIGTEEMGLVEAFEAKDEREQRDVCIPAPVCGMPCDEGMEEPCYDLLGQPTICEPSRKEPWHVGLGPPPPPMEEPTAPAGALVVFHPPERRPEAYVTLATNDVYALGAMVVGITLRKTGTTRKLVVMVTPEVSQEMRHVLSSVYDIIFDVWTIDSRDFSNLRLLGRSDLGVTFTKIHCWRLIQFSKCVFMDADTIVLSNVDDLFNRDELSAAPDAGWPDCFNSGVFVYIPSLETFEALLAFARSIGSFDGGDQGLLNLFFYAWATEDIRKHLPFTYNLVWQAFYSYQPAYKQFGHETKIVHFIGAMKPWHFRFNVLTCRVEHEVETVQSSDLLQLWWDVFMSQVLPRLSPAMKGLCGQLARLKVRALGQLTQEQLADRQRQYNWEKNLIDYMGCDCFANIKRRLDEVILCGGRQPEPPPPPPQRPPTPPSPSPYPPPSQPVSSPPPSPPPFPPPPVPPTPVDEDDYDMVAAGDKLDKIDFMDDSEREALEDKMDSIDSLRTLDRPSTKVIEPIVVPEKIVEQPPPKIEPCVAEKKKPVEMKVIPKMKKIVDRPSKRGICRDVRDRAPDQESAKCEGPGPRRDPTTSDRSSKEGIDLGLDEADTMDSVPGIGTEGTSKPPPPPSCP